VTRVLPADLTQIVVFAVAADVAHAVDGLLATVLAPHALVTGSVVRRVREYPGTQCRHGVWFKINGDTRDCIYCSFMNTETALPEMLK